MAHVAQRPRLKWGPVKLKLRKNNTVNKIGFAAGSFKCISKQFYTQFIYKPKCHCAAK